MPVVDTFEPLGAMPSFPIYSGAADAANRPYSSFGVRMGLGDSKQGY